MFIVKYLYINKENKMIKTFDISWKTYLLPTIHNEGWRFVGIFAAITALLAMIWEPLGWIGLVLTIWCYYFWNFFNGFSTHYFFL